MKKFTVLLLTAFAICSLSACNELNQAKSDLQGEISGFLGETSEILNGATSLIGETSELRSQLEEALHGSSSLLGDNLLTGDSAKAKSFDSYVTYFYNGIVSGEINDKDEKAVRAELSAELPSESESTAERRKKAAKFTIGDVISYQGENTDITGFCYAETGFGTHRRGEILAASDPDIKGNEDAVTDLKTSTTLAKLFE